MTTQKNEAKKITGEKPSDPAENLKPSTALAVVKPTSQDNDPAPLEDRILRINQLFELQSKYNRLQKSRNKLNEFKMKKGEENLSFTLRDQNNREEFSTSNPELIAAVMDCVRVTVAERIKALEPLLKW
jgi:hypothetical protein